MSDVPVCMWKTGLEERPNIIIISLYCDINKSAMGEVEAVIKYCVDNQFPVIIGAYSNSHSELWGCSKNNVRGTAFEEFICSEDLSICNISSKPTFKTCRASSIIDVTLVHLSLYDLIKEWNVSNDDFCSDHKCINSKWI
jgi:hypothetical protein